MNPTDIPTPIKIPRTSFWDIAWSTLRAAMILTSGMLVVLVYRREGIAAAVGSAAAVIAMLPAIIAYAFGVVKWLRVNRRQRIMANAVSNDVAVIK